MQVADLVEDEMLYVMAEMKSLKFVRTPFHAMFCQSVKLFSNCSQ
jgi:hypothetical protein